MLRAARENDPNRLDEVNIRNQVVTFLVAGHETTSGALSFALYYLARNREVLAAARAETDPAWGDDPERFDPDRFSPERVRGRAPHIYKPFGTGERACIGRQFAIHEAVLVLGTLLRRYDFVGAPDYQLRIQERLTLMPVGFTLTLQPRR